MAAAEEQHRRSKRGPLALRAARSCRKPRNGASPVPGPIMMIGTDKSSGRRKPALVSRTVAWMVSPARRLERIIRADALVDTAPGGRRPFDHADRDAAARRIDRRRRRDRVIARRQQREHFQISVERQFAGRIFLQHVEHRFAPRQNLGAITLGGLGLLADEGQQLRLGHRAAGVLRHDLDLLPCRHLLQLDELARAGVRPRRHRRPAVVRGGLRRPEA